MAEDNLQRMKTLDDAWNNQDCAMIQGAGAEDVTAIARVMESWAGVQIRRNTKQ